MEKREKIKKQWLIAFLINIIVYIAVTLVAQYDEGMWLLMSKTKRMALQTISYAVFALMSFAQYYCAYRKNGTKWLMAVMILYGLSIPTTLWSLFRPPPTVNPTLLFFYGPTAVSLLSGLYFAIQCFRLYKSQRKNSLAIIKE